MTRLASDEANIFTPAGHPLPHPVVVQNVSGAFFGVRHMASERDLERFARPGDIYVAYSPIQAGSPTYTGLTSMDEVGIVVRNEDARGQKTFPDSPAGALCRIAFPRAMAGCTWSKPAHVLRFFPPTSGNVGADELAASVAEFARQTFRSQDGLQGLSHGERLRLLQVWHGQGSAHAKKVANSEPVYRSTEFPAAMIALISGHWPARAYELSQLTALAQRSTANRSESQAENDSEIKRAVLAMASAGLLSKSPQEADVRSVSTYLEQLANLSITETPLALAQGKYDRVVGTAIYPFNYLRDAFEDGRSLTGRLHYLGSFETAELASVPKSGRNLEIMPYAGYLFGDATTVDELATKVKRRPPIVWIDRNNFRY